MRTGRIMDLYRYKDNVNTRWASFENQSAGKGTAGKSNRGGKGHSCEPLEAGATATLLDLRGSGVVTRIWMTPLIRTPEMLRSLRIDFFWDGAPTPAVSAPFGDFFGVGLGATAAFECDVFSSPGGRSFNCSIPMPFRSSARITITNESSIDLPIFAYDIDLLVNVRHRDDMLYFHCSWRRENPTFLGREFDILPRVSGRGRYLGCNMSVVADPIYNGVWWGEGEFKAWLDGDEEYPTLCGTGTEDYVGCGWEINEFAHRSQGCTVYEKDRCAFYRYHISDPVFFHTDFRAALQAMGGGLLTDVSAAEKSGAPMIPVLIDDHGKETLLLDDPVAGDLDELRRKYADDVGCCFYRRDDWTSTAYFYLDKPENGLPPLSPVETRNMASMFTSHREFSV